MKVTASSAVQTVAKEIVQHHTIIHQGDHFEVFEIPKDITRFKGYALLLFKESHDFLKGRAPKRTMIIPASVDNRQGYFIDREIARNYSESGPEG